MAEATVSGGAEIVSGEPGGGHDGGCADRHTNAARRAGKVSRSRADQSTRWWVQFGFGFADRGSADLQSGEDQSGFGVLPAGAGESVPGGGGRCGCGVQGIVEDVQASQHWDFWNLGGSDLDGGSGGAPRAVGNAAAGGAGDVLGASGLHASDGLATTVRTGRIAGETGAPQSESATRRRLRREHGSPGSSVVAAFRGFE